MTTFDCQPHLSDDRFSVLPLTADDFEGLFAAAADPQIWAGHPVKNRHEIQVFRPYFDFLLASGSAVCFRELASKAVIGCSRFYFPDAARQQCSIGFTFLTRSNWGGTANLAFKRLMLGHIFTDFDTAWFHIDPGNVRSQAATVKLGAVVVGTDVLDLGTGAARWMCFRLGRQEWLARAQRS